MIQATLLPIGKTNKTDNGFIFIACNYPFTPSDTFRHQSSLLPWDYPSG